MTFKISYVLVVFVALWSASQAAPTSKDSVNINYFNAFLERKFVSVNESSTSMCFRTQFPVDPFRNFRYVNGDPTNNQAELQLEWDLEHSQMDVLNKAYWRAVDGEAKCLSWFIEYVEKFKLPEKWSLGAEVNAFDMFMAHRLRVLERNYEEACKEPDQFFDFVNRLTNGITQVYSVEQTFNSTMVNMNVCWPFKKFVTTHGRNYHKL